MADYAFLHGGGQGSWVWEETIDALYRQTGGTFGRALALDVPGCGAKRGRSTDSLTLEDVARELVSDIEQEGLKDVVLVGHSQAGQALPSMLRSRPSLFRSAVYVSCTILPPGQTTLQVMGNGPHGSNENEVGWPFDPGAVTEMNDRYALMFCNDMSAEQTSAFLAKLGKDMWPMQTYAETRWSYDRLEQTPATFVICLQDAILTVPWQEKFAERVKAERRVHIDAGHQVMNTRPHALAEVLRHEASLVETK
jgi:pimeloyl-ACP methyl ester carboxylesterase